MVNETRVADELDQLGLGAGFLPLPDAGLVRVTGAGHRDALQRLLTQELRGLAPGAGRLALLLAPKGQFRALMGVFAGDGDTLLMAPPGRGGDLAEALRKYLALSRCSAEAIAPAEGASAIVGERWLDAATALGAAPGTLADGGWHVSALDGRPVSWFGRTLLGVPGAVLAGGGADAGRLLRGAGLRVVLARTVELARIRRGAPAWGAELTETVLPPEVGIEGETVSYSKGCYVGQETMARLEAHGHTTRTLVGLRQVRGEIAAPPLPAPLTAAGEAKERGALTSWGWHPEIGGVGLALVRIELAVAGTRVAGADREFEVTGFPLW